MNFIAVIVAAAFLTSFAHAEIKYLGDVIRHATQGPNADLTKTLSDIQLSPATDPATGKSVFKVTGVISGSIYEKAGIKVGDLVAMDRTPKKQLQKLGFQKGQVIKSIDGTAVESPTQARELYNNLETAKPDEAHE